MIVKIVLRRAAPLVLAVLIAGFVGGGPAAAQEKIARSVVEIVRSSGSLGAGVQIQAGIVLTAAHLVAAEATVTVRDEEGREQVGTVIAVDTTVDLALVNIPDPVLIAISPLSCKIPPIGLPVRMIGHPYGRLFVTVGGYVVSGLRAVSQWPTLVLINRRAFPGMSGGPLMSGQGEVVGLVVAATERGGRIGPAAAVPGSAICAFMPSESPEQAELTARAAGWSAPPEAGS